MSLIMTVIFGDTCTIHGSLATHNSKHSHASFTAHYGLDEGRFVPKKYKNTKRNGVSVVYSNFNLKSFLSEKLPTIRRPYQIIKKLLKQ